MTAAQLADIRNRIGTSALTDEEIEALYDELGTVDKVVLHVLEGRLTALLASPAKKTIEGDSSFDWSANLAALQKEVKALRDETGAVGLSVGRLVKTWSR